MLSRNVFYQTRKTRIKVLIARIILKKQKHTNFTIILCISCRFVPNCAEHERCCGEDSGVMVDDHSEEEEEDDSHITSSSALGACCGSASCTGVEGTKFADDCRIHHIVDHNAYRPRHKVELCSIRFIAFVSIKQSLDGIFGKRNYYYYYILCYLD